MRLKFSLVLIILFSWQQIFSNVQHDFHETLLSLTWNSKSRTFEGSLIADSEHFAHCLSIFTGRTITLDHLEKEELDNKSLTVYLNHYIQLFQKGKKKNWKITVIEVTYADIIFHLETSKMSRKIKNISVTNSFMLNEFPNQKNLFQIAYNDEQTSYLFTSENQYHSFDLP
jgi:hypothetical protein